MRLRAPESSPVELYWEDVSELVDLFKKYCEMVEVSDDKAIYDSLAEASEKINSTITNLEIVGTKPNITLSLKRGGSWLSQKFDRPQMTPEELDRHDVLYFRVKDYLAEKRNVISYLSGPLATLFLGLAFIAIGIAFVWRGPDDYRMIASGVAWLLMFIFLLAVDSMRKNIGTVSLKPKSAATTFWSRNRDKILLLFVGAAISEAINFFAHLHSK